jgi:chemotaxis protein methyltransferase CheR
MKATREQLEVFASLIKDEVGIVYSDANFFQLEGRLENFKTSHGLPSFSDLLQELRLSKSSLISRAFFDVATNNETSFFRDVHLFDAVEKNFLPMWWSKSEGKQTLEVWSAASSSGQEIYSLSMIVNHFKANHPSLKYRFYASDYSERMVKRVKDGIYSQIEVQRGLSTAKLLRYFDKVGEQSWKVKPELQQNLECFHANVLEPWTRKLKCDLILLRNILIYHTPENKKEIIRKIAESLNPGGFLILGSAENLFGISQDFSQIQWGSAIVYQKKTGGL